MSPTAQTAQAVTSTDVQTVFWILGLMGAAGTGAISVFLWFSRQLSQTRQQLYSKINKETSATDAKLKENSQLTHESKERLGLLELSNKHQESRLDGLDEKIDNVQKEITDTKKEVVAMNLKISENQLALVGEVRAIGDRFGNEIAKIQLQQTMNRN